MIGSSILLCLSICLSDLCQTVLLVSLPGLKLLLGSSLIESALLHATTEVLHQVHALTAEDVTYGVCGLGTNLNPIQCTLEIQVYCGRIGVGIVSTNLLSKTTITWCTSVGDNDK